MTDNMYLYGAACKLQANVCLINKSIYMLLGSKEIKHFINMICKYHVLFIYK